MTELEAYFCTLCGSKSTTYRDLLAHYKCSHGNFCQICRTFPSDRRQHILNEHRQIPCELCYDSFPNPEDYRSHYDTNHSIACLICGQTFNSIVSDNAHFQLVHKIKCELCDKTFNTEELKEKHCQAKHMIQCNLCPETFRYENNLMLHHQRKHQKQCHECDKRFDSETLLEMHLEAVHPKIRFDCLLCKESFESELLKSSHYNSVHEFDCEICQIIFSSEDKKQVHQLKAHQMECHVCQSYFKSTADLIAHYNQVHVVASSQPDARDDHIKDANSFMCRVCDKTFRKASCRRELYNKDGMFNCDLCIKSYESFSELQNHYQGYHRVRYNKANAVLMQEATKGMILCSQCDEGMFDTEMELVEHYKQAHVHLCDVCNDVLPEEEELRRLHPEKCKKVPTIRITYLGAQAASYKRHYQPPPPRVVSAATDRSYVPTHMSPIQTTRSYVYSKSQVSRNDRGSYNRRQEFRRYPSANNLYDSSSYSRYDDF